jgi:hypothetical protein
MGPSRRELAQVKTLSAYYHLHCAGELTESFAVTRNSSAKPARSQPRPRVAFFLLASPTHDDTNARASVVAVTEKCFRERCYGATVDSEKRELS